MSSYCFCFPSAVNMVTEVSQVTKTEENSRPMFRNRIQSGGFQCDDSHSRADADARIVNWIWNGTARSGRYLTAGFTAPPAPSET